MRKKILVGILGILLVIALIGCTTKNVADTSAPGTTGDANTAPPAADQTPVKEEAPVTNEPAPKENSEIIKLEGVDVKLDYDVAVRAGRLIDLRKDVTMDDFQKCVGQAKPDSMLDANTCISNLLSYSVKSKFTKDQIVGVCKDLEAVDKTSYKGSWECFRDVATLYQDISICNNVVGYTQAELDNDPTLISTDPKRRCNSFIYTAEKCDAENTTAAKDDCYRSLSIKTQVNMCDKVSDAYKKEKCVNEFGMRYLTPEENAENMLPLCKNQAKDDAALWLVVCKDAGVIGMIPTAFDDRVTKFILDSAKE